MNKKRHDFQIYFLEQYAAFISACHLDFGSIDG
jgi:hypothetical protein